MARRAICTTSTSTMPAAIDTTPRGPDFPDVTRSLWARLQRSPAGGCSRSVYRTIRASLRAHHLERPGSNRLRSCLTCSQPFSVSLAMLDGPCDPGNPSTARPIGRRFPGSHGPAEEKVSALRVNISLPFDRVAGSSDFLLPPGTWEPVSVPCRLPRSKPRFVAFPDRTGGSRPTVRGRCPTEAAMRCAARSNRLPRAAGPGTTRERGRRCERCPQISWRVRQRRGMRGAFR
jgi:hypothetical protein